MNDDAALILEQIQDMARQQDERRLFSYSPYDWQARFHNAGAENPERMLMAANRVGKTFCGAAEVAIHATGLYPKWWKGKVFPRNIRNMTIWVGSQTAEASREVVQVALCGGYDDEVLGTGAIPKEYISGKPTVRQAGMTQVIDMVKVKRIGGGQCRIIFKTYEQGYQKWTGAQPHVVWLDEEPVDYRIYTESMTRVLSSHGVLLVTFTPLEGMTSLVDHYVSPPASGIYLQRATWGQAPHLDESEKARLKASYPQHEVKARTAGEPLLGSGLVFYDVDFDDLVVQPFQIPNHWARICGIDFGISHPAAGAWLAWDRTQDVIYVYDCYRKTDQLVPYHAEAINRRGKWIPVSWPHDGHTRDRAVQVGKGKQYLDYTATKELRHHYMDHGVNMLPVSARYRNDSTGKQDPEPIIMEAHERMMTGRFRIFATCTPLLDEIRNFHRKDGRIVDRGEDTIKAALYGLMMKRYALTPQPTVAQSGFTRPIVGA